NVNAGQAPGELLAQVADNFLSVAFALGTRLELDQNVSFILLGCEEAQLGAGSAGKSSDFRSLLHPLFHLSHDAISLSQRRARRRQIIDYEATFVHLRQKSGCDRAVEKNRQRDGHQSDNPDQLTALESARKNCSVSTIDGRNEVFGGTAM